MSPEAFLNGKVSLYCGDCLDVLKTLEPNSVDSVVTDPPYHLTTNKKGGTGAASVNLDSPYGRARIGTGNGAGGFMGKAWDGGDTAFRVELWAEALRVLKPGGHLAAFGGTRTYHRMACAIEDAGFEIRDSLQWLYGSGFPKSKNIGGGFGTALKPACEPIVLARKLLVGTVAENVLQHGTGALNIDGCRVATGEDLNGGCHSPKAGPRAMAPGGGHRNVTAGVFVQPNGRWPANVIHDGGDDVLAAFPDALGQQFYVGPKHGDRPSRGIYGDFGARPDNPPRGDSGSAARFFYTAKADEDDRIGSKHPTVKPVDLMQWLVRLITPPGGLVLDLFAGTGTTGEAAWREGMRAVLIEREPEYQDDIRRRMKLAMAGPREREHAIAKAKNIGKTEDLSGTLFAANNQ